MKIKSLSPSKVDTFFGCKRLFLYRYITKPIAPPESKYFLIGNVVHKALESFHKLADKDNPSSWKGLMTDCFKRAFSSYSVFEKEKQGVVSREDMHSMKRMLNKYLKRQYSIRSLPETLYIEKLFKITIEGTQVWGKADRVDKEGDGAIVVDYKTGSRPFTKKDISNSVQLGTYALWARSLGISGDIYGEYIHVKILDTAKGRQKFLISDDIMEKAKKKYTEVISELDDGCNFEKNHKYKYCRTCEYKRFCERDDT